MSDVSISSGVTSSGLVLGSGASVFILSGGALTSTTVTAGGAVSVWFDGLTNDTTVSSGGQEIELWGLSVDTTVSSGGGLIGYAIYYNMSQGNYTGVAYSIGNFLVGNSVVGGFARMNQALGLNTRQSQSSAGAMSQVAVMGAPMHVINPLRDAPVILCVLFIIAILDYGLRIQMRIAWAAVYGKKVCIGFGSLTFIRGALIGLACVTGAIVVIRRDVELDNYMKIAIFCLMLLGSYDGYEAWREIKSSSD